MEAELQAVLHLVKDLPITANAEVDVVELGLRLTETLYLTSQGSIQVSDQIDLPLEQSFLQTSDDWEAYVVPLSGATLYELYDEHKSALFSANLRDFLGTRKSSGNVNNQIKETAENNGADFFVLNNGVTLITKKAELVGDSLRIHGVSVVNGAQTTGAIYAAGAEKAASVSILARIIVAKDPALIPAIVAGNNTQNSIVAWDRRSNDPIQIRIAQEFESKGITYVHRRDFSRRPATSIFAGQVGQMLCAFGGDLQTAIRAKADIFESDVTYNEVFPATLSIGHVFAVQALGWAYDQIKQELKGKAASGAMTALEQRQLKLLDYPASKQFMMTIVGNLREEIAGTKVETPQALEMKPECLTPDGADAIAAWNKVLRSILPIIAQGLPGEEYQVVRSTELTNIVAGRTKGIVAGTEILQSSFQELRGLLKPI